MDRTLRAAALCVAGMLAAGCGATEAAMPEDEAATLTLHLSAPNPGFTGNSVRIKGFRGGRSGSTDLPAAPADLKYPCHSVIEDGGEVGKCINFADGSGTVQIKNLCPSTPNIPVDAAGWTFEYEVYSSSDCEDGTGLLLNATGNPNNFVCYDSQDVFTRANANRTVGEQLLIGDNDNVVICLSQNAIKNWDFDVCAIESYQPATTTVAEQLVLSCGCTWTGTACDCDQNLGNLPTECALQTVSPCNLVCTGTTLPPP